MTDLIAPIPVAARMVDLGTHRVAVVEVGRGDPVIFLHGGLMDHQSWGNQLPLADGYRLILPDTRGHGQSGGGDLPATYGDFARDVVALMDALGLARAAIVGFSDGGCAALHLALASPERISDLVVIGAPYNRTAYNPGVVEGYASLTPEALDGARPLVREVIRKLRQHMSDADWAAYWPRVIHGLWVNEPNLTLADFADLPVRTLVLHGEHEASVSLQGSRDLAATIPDGRLTIIDGATHSAAQDRPDLVNAAIRSFLDANPARIADGGG